MIGDCLLSILVVYLSVEFYYGKVIIEYYFIYNNNWYVLIDDSFFKWYIEFTVIFNFLILFVVKIYYKFIVRFVVFCFFGF